MTHRETEQRIRELQALLQKQAKCKHAWILVQDERDALMFHLQCEKCDQRVRSEEVMR